MTDGFLSADLKIIFRQTIYITFSIQEKCSEK